MAELTTDEMIKALGIIYTPEFGDWDLTTSASLTEPTCPSATIAPEYENDLGFSFQAYGDTVEEAVAGAVKQAFEALVARQGFRPLVPWTNPGDATGLARVLEAMDRYRAERGSGAGQ